jgi:hypothetical protein
MVSVKYNLENRMSEEELFRIAEDSDGIYSLEMWEAAKEIIEDRNLSAPEQ